MDISELPGRKPLESLPSDPTRDTSTCAGSNFGLQPELLAPEANEGCRMPLGALESTRARGVAKSREDPNVSNPSLLIGGVPGCSGESDHSWRGPPPRPNCSKPGLINMGSTFGRAPKWLCYRPVSQGVRDALQKRTPTSSGKLAWGA